MSYEFKQRFGNRRENEMKSVDIYQNSDGTWTARIFNYSMKFKTYSEAMAWLRNQGEYQT